MPDSTLDSFTGKVTKVDDITLKKFMEIKLKKLYFTNNLKDVENYNDDSYVFLPFFKENPYVGNMVAYWKISGKKTWEVNNFNICDWIKKNINV